MQQGKRMKDQGRSAHPLSVKMCESRTGALLVAWAEGGGALAGGGHSPSHVLY